MSDKNPILDAYLTGLRNQHAVETQAIGTIQNELPRMKEYAELHARMQQDKERSTSQAARLDQMLAKHGSSKSLVKEAVTGAVATVAGFVHAGSDDDVVKNVLAAIGFKAYEAGSYKVLATMAEMAGASEDVSILQGMKSEEDEMGNWLGEYLPTMLKQYAGTLRA